MGTGQPGPHVRVPAAGVVVGPGRPGDKLVGGPRSDSLDALDRGREGAAQPRRGKRKRDSLVDAEALVRGPDRLAGHVTRPTVSWVRVKTGVRKGLGRRRRAGRRPGGGRRRRGVEEAVGPGASVA